MQRLIKRSTKESYKHSYLLRNVLTVCILALVVSCQSQKKTVSKNKNTKPDKYAITQNYGPVSVDSIPGLTKPGTTGKPVIDEGKKAELTATLEKLWKQEIAFNTFSGKAKMHFKGNGQSYDFATSIRIQKDKAIWANVVAYGLVNVARAYITPDSIFVINYLQKEIIRMPISQAGKVLPAQVDFGTLQNFLIGNVLKQTGTVTDVADANGEWTIKVEDEDLVQHVAYNKTDGNMKTLQMQTKKKQTSGLVQYAGYEKIADRNFSNGRVINLNNEGQEYYLDMDFNGVEFDQPVEMPFSMPKNYTVK